MDLVDRVGFLDNLDPKSMQYGINLYKMPHPQQQSNTIVIVRFNKIKTIRQDKQTKQIVNVFFPPTISCGSRDRQPHDKATVGLANAQAVGTLNPYIAYHTYIYKI